MRTFIEFEVDLLCNLTKNELHIAHFTENVKTCTFNRKFHQVVNSLSLAIIINFILKYQYGRNHLRCNSRVPLKTSNVLEKYQEIYLICSKHIPATIPNVYTQTVRSDKHKSIQIIRSHYFTYALSCMYIRDHMEAITINWLAKKIKLFPQKLRQYETLMEQCRGESISKTPETSSLWNQWMAERCYCGPRSASAVTHNCMVKYNDTFNFSLDYMFFFKKRKLIIISTTLKFDDSISVKHGGILYRYAAKGHYCQGPWSFDILQ